MTHGDDFIGAGPQLALSVSPRRMSGQFCPEGGTALDALFGGTEPAFRVSVVIPARNEAPNLPHVIEALPAGLYEVIVVDGHSDDDTIEVARRLRPDVKIVQQTRRGKGNALACGFAELTGDVVVMLDADGSADPREIPAFVARWKPEPISRRVLASIMEAVATILPGSAR